MIAEYRIEEMNIQIAKFMGGKIEDVDSPFGDPVACFFFKDKINPFPFHSLRYHFDWNWLMLVVEKINSMDENKYQLTIYDRGAVIEYNWYGRHDKEQGSLFKIDAKTTIESVYLIVFNFIEWWNKKNLKDDNRTIQI